GLLPIEPAVVFAPRKPVSNDALAHDYRTLNAVASRRDAAEAFTDFSYGHGDARNQSRKCFGVLGGPKYVVDEAVQLNHAKDALKEAVQRIANYRIQVRRGESDDPALPRHREVSTELLRQIGRADLNLLAAYRHVPIIDEPVHAIRFLITRTRSVPRISVRDLREKAKNRPDLLDRLDAVPGLADDEFLLAPKKRYSRMRAKILLQRMQHEQPKQRAQLIVSAELPILFLREKADSRWPDIKGPRSTETRRKAPPAKMEDEPLLVLGKQAYFRLRKKYR
ncbi:MAG: hypothetical protein MI757_19420, partial [Pirellulales bacterium]|nr:hypothetical protein [Pirellulales bacterium]